MSAIVLSIVIAMAFMPSLGAVDQADAYAGEWSIESNPSEIYASYGDGVQLDVTLNYDEDLGAPEIEVYRWYLADENYDFPDEPTETTEDPSLWLGEVYAYQYWKCEAVDSEGDTRDCAFDVYVEQVMNWHIDTTDDADSFYYDVEEGQNIEMDPALNIIYDEGYDSSNFKFTYDWRIEAYDEESDEWDYVSIDGANQKKYVAKNVTEGTNYRLYVTDQYGNTDFAYVYLSVITADQKKADKVTEAIDKIKDIANITLADKAGIMAAKAAYDALSLDQKNLLYTSDINKLMEAIKKIEALEAEAKAKAEAEAKAKAEAEAKAKAEAEAKAKAEKKAIAKAKKLKVKSFKVKAAKGKKATVTWKATKGAKGYQIMYSLNKKFKKAKKVNIKKANAKKAVINKLKAKKKYFVKIRPYSVVKKANGKKVTVYGKWSKVKIIKAK